MSGQSTDLDVQSLVKRAEEHWDRAGEHSAGRLPFDVRSILHSSQSDSVMLAYDLLAWEVARRFYSGANGFEFCDWVINCLAAQQTHYMSEARPVSCSNGEIMSAVYEAFDAGELAAHDPERRTRPMVAAILSNTGFKQKIA